MKNLQGDIIAIVDEKGQTIVEYSYDAWGNVTFSESSLQNMTKASTLCFVSPFTYRGYCYDYDIELYYLQSRYYSAEIGRFINTDDTQIAIETQGEVLGANLFAYCNNNPVINVDYTGKLAMSMAIGAIIGAVFGIVGYYLDELFDYIYKKGYRIEYVVKNVRSIFSVVKKNLSLWKMINFAGIGALNGAVSTHVKFKVAASLISAVTDFIKERKSGSSIWQALLMTIATALLTCFLNSAQSFSRFNFKRLGRSLNILKKINKNTLYKFFKEIGNTFIYYFKVNKTLYKNFIVKYSFGSMYNIAVGLGLEKLYRKVFR